MDEQSTDLIVSAPQNAVAIFGTDGGSKTVIDAVKKIIDGMVLDISTSKGRDEIKSVAYKIARTKTALDEQGKILKADMQKTVDLVDAERKKIRDALDELKETVRKPLTDWENAEKMRVKIREDRIAVIINLANPLIPNPDVETIEAHLAQLKETEVFDWQEFSMRAEATAKATRDKLESLKAARIKYDADQAELARLRAEQEKRDQEERDARIAKEAAEKATKEAEQKAAADAKAAQEKADREKREADERADAERKAREDVEKRNADLEAQRKADAERAEVEKKEAADKAAQAERDRQEAERKREADELAKREADKQHRTKINREVMSALVQHGITEDQAKAIITAIVKGEVPHTKINY